MTSAVLVSTWAEGLFLVSDGMIDRELADHSLSGLAPDGHGGALAVVDGRSLCRRAPDGVWSTIVTAELKLRCCVTVGDTIYVGTDDARVLRVSAAGQIEQLRGFEGTAGRDKWYAGTALINGKLVGPPLGIRSITATSDGRVLLANVHVGGIPRSVDGGATWHPTIDIDSDVHEVRAHPNRSGIVAAAAAAGLCSSSDGGATWQIEQAGLHASYCSAVAFAGDDVLVSAATDHFASRGAIYRWSVDERCPLVRVTGGLPDWLEGIADTGCIATHGSAVAVADGKGNLHLSSDNGCTWSSQVAGIPMPSGVLIV
ncbi:MAG: WD40/YVTN/BNR-like repeat-containing protein [Blastocatellia bacterium]